jgi:hypothetical protein
MGAESKDKAEIQRIKPGRRGMAAPKVFEVLESRGTGKRLNF